MKYGALYRIMFHAKDKAATLADLPPLDRQAWGTIEALRSFRMFDLWWSDLGDEHQNTAFDKVKKEIKTG